MKLLTGKLGHIIVVIAAVALLISVVAVSTSPVSTFFGNVVDKETGIAQDMIDSFGEPFVGGGSGGSGVGGAIENTGVVPAGGVYTVKATGQVLNGGDALPTPLSNGDVFEYKDVLYTLSDSADDITPSWSARADYTIYRTATYAASAPVATEVFGYSVVNNIATTNVINDTVPEDATYTVASTGEVLKSGDTLPSEPGDGDICIYGDYEYRYNMYWSNIRTVSCEGIINVWFTSPGQNGWGVAVFDTSYASYSAILTTINNKPVTNMNHCYAECESLTTSPVIPDKINDIQGIFSHCRSLFDVSDLKIPEGVLDLSYAFSGCESLTTAPTIPNGVTNMEKTFYGCTSLKTAPEIPNSVTSMYHTFEKCTALVATPNISDNATNISAVFVGCTSLTDTSLFKVPSTVISMDQVFSGCTSLVDVSNITIPNHITTMRETFYGCTSLKTAPTIPDTHMEMEEAFYKCTSLASVPGMLDGTKMTANKYLEYTFYGCKNLTGTMLLQDPFYVSAVGVKKCFYGTEKEIIIVYDKKCSETASFLKATANNGNVTVQYINSGT